MNFLETDIEKKYEFNLRNKEIASKLFTEEEKTLFINIYNFNFLNKLRDPTINLFKGIDITPISDNETISYEKFEINDNLLFNDNTNVYTPEFKQSMIDIDNIINNEGHDDNLKYILIGHKLNDFECNKNNFRFKLIKHILNYCKCIKINKSILLKNQQKAIQRAAILIGNCDFESLESFSIKEIEDWIRELPDTNLEIFMNRLKSMGSIGTYFNNKVAKIMNRIKGKREIDETPEREIDQIQPQEQQTEPDKIILKEITDKMNRVRMNIMSLDELNKNNFCTDFEMALTYEKYKTSKKWFSNPQLVAFAGANATMTIQSIVKTYDTKINPVESVIRQTTHRINPHALATFVTTALGPLIGLFISIGVSFFLDSEFYKNLRNTRQINLNFIKWISKNSFLTNELESGGSCSYRNDKIDYTRRVESATLIINEYLDQANQHFNQHIKKLEFYLYAYYYRCKIINTQIESNLPRPIIGQREIKSIQKTIEKEKKSNESTQEEKDLKNINNLINIRINNSDNITTLRKGYLSSLYNELPDEKRNDFLNKIDATLNLKTENGKFIIKKSNENKEQLIKNLQEFYKDNDYPMEDEFYGGKKIRKNHYKQTKRIYTNYKRRTLRK